MKKYLLLMGLTGLSQLCFAQSEVVTMLPGSSEIINSSSDNATYAFKATLSSLNGGIYSTSIRGITNSLNGNGIGIWGTHMGNGTGVMGNSEKGNGLLGSSIDGVGIYSESFNSYSAHFGQNNTENVNSVVFINSKGLGRGLDVTLTNITNSAPAFSGSTYGTGTAAYFINKNTQGKGAGLLVTKEEAYAGPYSLDVNVDLEVRHQTSNASGMAGLRIMNLGPNNSNWTLYTSNSGANLYLYNNGIVRGNFNGSTGAYTSTSDFRLKTAIKDYTSTLDRMMKMEVKSYQLLKSEKTEIGLVAQETLKLFPEVVYDNVNDNGEQFYTMDYSRIGVIAIKAIQEQQSIITKQQQVLQQHEEAITILKNELTELKKALGK